ncbi:MAG: MotA/TolQ/ExbB proton channel family protein, partial [Gammaproteobacteria bacterium]
NFIALVFSVILVHMIYIGYVRPEANTLIEISQAEGRQAVPRDVVVIVKDYEQEICFILLLWGCFLITNSYREILKTKYLYSVDLIEDIDKSSLDVDSIVDLIEDKDKDIINVDGIIEKLDKQIPKDCLSSPLVQTLRSSLWRYAATRNVQNLSDAIESNLDALAVRQDSENTMIRYLIWAIPSIGFIGTVRGIGQALSMADQALAGDISGMTDSLGVAFNSTLVALLISIFLMFLYHQLQRLQDTQILDTQEYCEKYLLSRIR